MRGYIFRCNARTKIEVFNRSLFGDEAMYLPVVKKITQEDKLFLYDLSTFEFSGPYAPVGNGGSHLIPAAWRSRFPAQIRFKIIPETRTIPFKSIEKVIKVYHKGMFPDMLLDEEQVLAVLTTIKNASEK